MKDNSQKLIIFANKSFGDVLRDGFKLFSQTYKTLILPLALFQILLIILNVLLLTDLNLYIDSLGITTEGIMDRFIETTTLDPEEIRTLMIFFGLSIVSIFLQNVIGAIIIAIAMCSVSSYVYKTYLNEDVSFLESFKSAFNKKIFLVILILGICLPISFLVYIPALFIFAFFIFSVFTFNMEQDKKPLSEARAIAKGNFWKIIGVFIINVIIISIISSTFNFIVDFFLINESTIPIINSWYDPTTRNFGMLILYNILYSVIDIIFAPLFICLLTALFSSLKAKKELKYQYPPESYPTRDMYQESYRILRQEPYREIETERLPAIPEMRGETGLYCPFCGTLIQTPKRFCPKCGENLENILGI